MYRWVGQVLLGHPSPRVVGEVGFLEREDGASESDAGAPVEDVGRIDKILVATRRGPLVWCALEVQAVYFSGSGMDREWPAIANYQGGGLPFPVGIRRPDYRSSGPKRLMPQLQIKVPSLRRWGKKLGVVVDEGFWHSLSRMDEVDDVSNCDVAWFVMRYEEGIRGTRLVPGQVHLTTLERSVEGLTAGHPVSLEVFERRVQDKLRNA